MAHRELVRDDYLNHRQAEHEHFLFEGAEFPISRAELVDFATDLALDPDTMNLVRSLPDRVFTGADDVWRAWSEAMRVFAGGGGASRDDLGKERTARHPSV